MPAIPVTRRSQSLTLPVIVNPCLRAQQSELLFQSLFRQAVLHDAQHEKILDAWRKEELLWHDWTQELRTALEPFASMRPWETPHAEWLEAARRAVSR
jgi:hypothetical protein